MNTNHSDTKPDLVDVPPSQTTTQQTGNGSNIDPQHQLTNNNANNRQTLDNDNLNQTSGCNSTTMNSNEGNTSVQSGTSSEAGCVNKAPNSYKYPLLKKYFEFGPWIGRNRKALCVHCKTQSSSSQPDRLLKHLNKCNALSETDKCVVSDLMNERTANKRKKPTTPGAKGRRDTDNESEYDGQSANLADESESPNQNSIPYIPTKRPRRENQDRNSQIDEALTRWIISCRIPLKAIHSREFVEFCRALDPNYHIPSRETITNDLIPGLLNIL